MSNTGLNGFDGSGEFDLIAGSVTGLRWWTAFDGTLQGMRGPWQPGQNEATCSVQPSMPVISSAWDDIAWVNGVPTRISDIPPEHQPIKHQPPEESCGCGFWAYWDLENNNPSYHGIAVCGIIEGTGRVLIGEKGFRCQYAEVIALHVPYPVYPDDDSSWSEQRYKLAPAEWLYTRTHLQRSYLGVPLYGTLELMLEEHPTDRGDSSSFLPVTAAFGIRSIRPTYRPSVVIRLAST